MPQPSLAAKPAASLADALDGRTDITAWIRATAQQAGVTAAVQRIDVFANAISRLSDAGVQLDGIEQLLLALDRAGIVTGRDAVRLHAAYLRQKT